MNTTEQLLHLERYLRALGPVAVAVSGGVDSMTLAIVAHRVNNNSKMYHAVSPAVPDAATERVQRYADKENWQLRIVNAREVEDRRYRRNPVNRCYYCKNNLYSTVSVDLASFESKLTIASGTNLDDLEDYRPGLVAAEEHKVRHPYVEAGIDKNSIRAIAKLLQLTDLQELPAAPCLASRVTTGIAIDEKLLPVIDRVETTVWENFGESLSLSAVRCRILPDKVSIQLQGELDFDLGHLDFPLIQSTVKTLLSEAGYNQYQIVTVDPYRRGSAFRAETIEVVNLG